MAGAGKKRVSTFMLVVAFATVYIVWGSTYFFIQKAILHIPPFLMGTVRFFTAGLILLSWCALNGERLWVRSEIKHAVISGVLMLFIGNGSVIWAEQTLPSSLVAVLVSAAPIWFVLLDKRNWKENFRSKATVLGLIVGFIGVILLFSERAILALSDAGTVLQIVGLIILVIGSISWASGSLYSKYRDHSSASVNSAWQMIAAGFAFLPASLLHSEWSGFQWRQVTMESWLSLVYLIFMGSLAAYSAYIWLLKVRSATQVSTYAYVNPVVAILLGAFFAAEKITLIQITGLAVILLSVLLINLAKYRRKKAFASKERILPPEDKYYLKRQKQETI